MCTCFAIYLHIPAHGSNTGFYDYLVPYEVYQPNIWCYLAHFIYKKIGILIIFLAYFLLILRFMKIFFSVVVI